MQSVRATTGAFRVDMAASAAFADIMMRFHSGEELARDDWETMRWVHGRAKLDEMLAKREADEQS